MSNDWFVPWLVSTLVAAGFGAGFGWYSFWAREWRKRYESKSRLVDSYHGALMALARYVVENKASRDETEPT